MKQERPILLLTNLRTENPTARTIFEGLGRAYFEAGYPVLAAGPSVLLCHGRSAPIVRRPWGELHRLGGPSFALERRLRLASRQITALTRRSRFVHLHFGCAADPTEAVKEVLERVPVPYAVTFQDYANPFYGDRSERAKRRLREVLRRCRWITALSPASARLVAADFPEAAARLRVVPNGVDAEGAEAGITERRRRLGPYVLCLSRQAVFKGIDILIMAWADAIKNGVRARLLVCGPDDTPGHYKRLAKLLGAANFIRFCGEVSKEGARRLIDGARFCVLPSRHEAFGMAALEAMSRGKAVVATRSGGPESFVEDGVSGLLVPPGDVDALRGAMERLMRDGGLRRKLGRAARVRANRYSWSRAAKDYLSFFRGAD